MREAGNDTASQSDGSRNQGENEGRCRQGENMRKLKFKELTAESFQNYGTFSNLINPRAIKIGEEPCEFFRDILQLNLGPASIASYSVCRLLSRDRIITNAEFHSYCSEGIFAIDGEVLMPVAAATQNGAFNPD